MNFVMKNRKSLILSSLAYIHMYVSHAPYSHGIQKYHFYLQVWFGIQKYHFYLQVWYDMYLPTWWRWCVLLRERQTVCIIPVSFPGCPLVSSRSLICRYWLHRCHYFPIYSTLCAWTKWPQNTWLVAEVCWIGKMLVPLRRHYQQWYAMLKATIKIMT